MKPCELFSLVPGEKLDYLFEHSGASAELDYTFLGFEDVYKDVLNFVPKDRTIIDLGCGYAAQSFFPPWVSTPRTSLQSVPASLTKRQGNWSQRHSPIAAFITPVRLHLDFQNFLHII